MDSISIINEKINQSRRTLCCLINRYLQEKISDEEFWAEQKILDTQTMIRGEVKRKRLFFYPLKEILHYRRAEYHHSSKKNLINHSR